MKTTSVILIALFLFSGATLRAQKTDLEPCKRGRSWGFCNSEGKLQIAARYDSAFHFENQTARVMKDNYFGLIDAKGYELIPCLYHGVFYMKNFPDLVLVKIKNKYSYYSLQHRSLLGFQYGVDESANPFRIEGTYSHIEAENVIEAELGGKWGIINGKGEQLVQLRYDEIRLKTNEEASLSFIRKGENYAMFHPKGIRLTQFVYPEVLGFWENYGVARRNTKNWIFLQDDGNEAYSISPQGSLTHVFEKSGKYGAINQNGKEIVPFEFDTAYVVPENDFVIVKSYTKYGLFSNTGKKLVHPKFDVIKPKDENSFVIKNAGKTGKLDLSGRETWEE